MRTLLSLILHVLRSKTITISIKFHFLCLNGKQQHNNVVATKKIQILKSLIKRNRKSICTYAHICLNLFAPPHIPHPPPPFIILRSFKDNHRFSIFNFSILQKQQSIFREQSYVTHSPQNMYTSTLKDEELHLRTQIVNIMNRWSVGCLKTKDYFIINDFHNFFIINNIFFPHIVLYLEISNFQYL